MSLDPGARLGRYEVIGRLGQGGMAAVYKARDPSLDRIVALKVIRTDLTEDAEFLERFRREARAIARLDHPNIVQVFEFAEAGGMPFLAMQYLEGGTLKERVAALAAAGERLPRAEAVAILAQVADALAYAHARGIVHRDVKPANVMLTSDGRAVVTDFGIAKIVSGTQYTQTGVGIGTPEYMSPEQGQGGTVDARSDVYSLGVMAYELLTGRLPFTADTPVAVVIKHMRDKLLPPSSIDPTVGPELERAVTRAMAKEPTDRFQSASELAGALRAAVGQSAGVTAPTLVVPRQRSGALLGRVPVLAAAGAALLLIGGGAALVGQLSATRDAERTAAPTATAAAIAVASPVATTAFAPTATIAPASPTVATTAPAVTASAAPATPAPTPEPATPPPPTPQPATGPPATIAPTPTPAAITGPRSVAMEKATFSASTEKLGVIVSNYPIGTEVVLVSAKHESGFEQPLNVKFSTNSNPYAIRSDWLGPIGKYTMRVTAAGTPYDLAFTVTN